jgi:hypothetical protein
LKENIFAQIVEEMDGYRITDQVAMEMPVENHVPFKSNVKDVRELERFKNE